MPEYDTVSRRFSANVDHANQQLTRIQARFDTIVANEDKITAAAHEMGRTLTTILSQIDSHAKTVSTTIETLSELIRNMPASDTVQNISSVSSLSSSFASHSIQNTSIQSAFTPTPNVNITLNDTDTGGIYRSQGQISTIIARAVNRGLKNI